MANCQISPPSNLSTGIVLKLLTNAKMGNNPLKPPTTQPSVVSTHVRYRVRKWKRTVSSQTSLLFCQLQVVFSGTPKTTLPLPCGTPMGSLVQRGKNLRNLVFLPKWG